MIPLDEADRELFKENMTRKDLVHLSMLPEQANYLLGYLTAAFPFVAKEGKDNFNLIMKWLEKALSYYEFKDDKDNDDLQQPKERVRTGSKWG